MLADFHAALMNGTANPLVTFMHCLPAFHDQATAVNHEIMEHTGMALGLEVTSEVFESAASSVFDETGTGSTIKAILVVMVGR
jgi:ornithine carbamoyltransferase